MADAGRILIIPRGDYSANSTYEKLDLVKHKGTSWLAKKDVVGIEPSKANAEYWYPMVDLSGYLPTDGGEVSNESGVPIRVRGTSKFALTKYLASDGSSFGFLGFEGVDNPVAYSSDGNVAYHVYTTKNKPTVTYTGNGDATARTINIGGIGDVMCINNDTDLSMAIVTPSGYIAKTADGVVTCGTDTYANSGVLTVRTTSAIFNTVGVTYICRVL